MEKVLKIDPEKCTACKLCELGCSMRNEGEFNLAKSRIRVVIFEDHFYLPMTCMHCDPAPCQDVCPTYAIQTNAGSGSLEVLDDRCITCGLCVMACPFGAIQTLPGATRAIKCELCGGDPECARICPTEAITWVPADSVVLDKQHQIAYALRGGATLEGAVA